MSTELQGRIQKTFHITRRYACDARLLDKASVSLTVTNASGFDPDVTIEFRRPSHIADEKEIRIFLILRQL